MSDNTNLTGAETPPPVPAATPAAATATADGSTPVTATTPPTKSARTLWALIVAIVAIAAGVSNSLPSVDAKQDAVTEEAAEAEPAAAEVGTRERRVHRGLTPILRSSPRRAPHTTVRRRSRW